jgi:2-polyprenyl-6-hydroxyphenyl methylase/3-demethylubiquinone-9 3-methyltransferase
MAESTSIEHAREIASGDRFEFGSNWKLFLRTLDDAKISAASGELLSKLGVSSLAGKRFLDVGSGSGLSSLVARQAGARVHSFDYDPNSVACTRELRRRYFPNDPDWVVDSGSVLDAEYLASLGQFDVVYSWGVLHHTGRMWEALANVEPLVAPGGKLFISIYNDQGTPSRRWLKVKRMYNRLPPALRFVVLWPSFLHLWWRPIVKDMLRLDPLRSFRAYGGYRGMSLWRDVVDWVGGYPFEVAKPEKIFDFYFQRGFQLTQMMTEGGSLGCNEFVFARTDREHQATP